MSSDGGGELQTLYTVETKQNVPVIHSKSQGGRSIGAVAYWAAAIPEFKWVAYVGAGNGRDTYVFPAALNVRHRI